MACALSASTVSSAAAPLPSPKLAASPQSLSFPRTFAGAAARPLRLARSARTHSFAATSAGHIFLLSAVRFSPDGEPIAVAVGRFIQIGLSPAFRKEFSRVLPPSTPLAPPGPTVAVASLVSPRCHLARPLPSSASSPLGAIRLASPDAAAGASSPGQSLLLVCPWTSHLPREHWRSCQLLMFSCFLPILLHL